MPAISNLLSIGQCVRYGLGNGMRNPLLKLALNSSGRPSLAVPGSRILLVSRPSWAITGVFPSGPEPRSPLQSVDHPAAAARRNPPNKGGSIIRLSRRCQAPWQEQAHPWAHCRHRNVHYDGRISEVGRRDGWRPAPTTRAIVLPKSCAEPKSPGRRPPLKKPCWA